MKFVISGKMQGTVWLVLLALATRVTSEEEERGEQGRCRTVKDTMLTCLEATVEDLPTTKQEAVSWLLFVRSRVPVIGRKTMKLFPSLTDLHATNAGVETVEEDAFLDLKDLNWVDLSHNKLTSLNSGILREAKTFYYLNVSGNSDLIVPKDEPFLDSAKMNWLDMSFCGIKELYPDTFTKLRGLKVLSLAGNKLKALPEGVFKPLQNLYSLDLSGNLFQSISFNAFKDMKHLSLYLGKNPWECDCSLLPFMEWAKTRRLKDEVRCAAPSDKLNKLWSEVNVTGCEKSLVEVF